MNVKFALAAAVLASCAGLACGADDGTAQLKLLAQGASSKLGGYMPQRLTLTDKKPEAVKKVPENLAAPMYGTLAISGAEKTATYTVVIDEPDGKPAHLYVDANGNGDLTDDGDASWTGKEAGTTDDGKSLQMYSGGAMVNLGTKDKPYEVHIAMYRFDKNDPGRAALKDVLLYYSDYATEGEMKIGEKTYKVMLADNLAKGDFRGVEGGDRSGVQLLVDVNGNGKFDGRGETFDVRKPFNLEGTTYELKDVSKDGLAFKVAKSSQTVAAEPINPDLSDGRPAVAFEAAKMDGKTVKFPGDYKGKVVMIDFWATWCPPCMGEMPNVVANYEKYHDKGFEILGISLDQADKAELVKSVTKDKGMAWPQVYDGGYWKARIAQLYGIESIPKAFLVDGDTGKIITSELRGPALGKAIEKALGEKNKH